MAVRLSLRQERAAWEDLGFARLPNSPASWGLEGFVFAYGAQVTGTILAAIRCLDAILSEYQARLITAAVRAPSESATASATL